jgi:hypothetical protein
MRNDPQQASVYGTAASWREHVFVCGLMKAGSWWLQRTGKVLGCDVQDLRLHSLDRLRANLGVRTRHALPEIHNDRWPELDFRMTGEPPGSFLFLCPLVRPSGQFDECMQRLRLTPQDRLELFAAVRVLVLSILTTAKEPSCGDLSCAPVHTS